MGGGNVIGSPRILATEAQRRARRAGLGEIAIARAALAAAGGAERDIDKISDAARRLDQYREVLSQPSHRARPVMGRHR